LASRARRRVHGSETPPHSDLDQQRPVVDAFLAALRSGDVEGLIRVLDPEVVVRIDEAAASSVGPREIHGARTFATGAVAFARMARSSQVMLVDGAVGLVWASGGRLSRAVKFRIANGKITHVEILAAPASLRKLDLAVVKD
jgi:RNA polymerase sigma-70 factor (ECF subfamily)